MTVLAFLFAAYLTCDKPNMFFIDNTDDKYLSNPVPAEYVFDAKNGENKILRVSTNTAAFYYSVVSAYLERTLLLGEHHGQIAGYHTGYTNEAYGFRYYDPWTENEVYSLLASQKFRWTNLNINNAVSILSNENRSVTNVYRLCEGDQTKRLFWATRGLLFDPGVFKDYSDGHGNIVYHSDDFPPVYSTALEDFGSLEFPEYEWVGKDHNFQSDFTPEKKAKTWMSLRSLTCDGVFMTNETLRLTEEVHPHVKFAAESMSSYSDGYQNAPSAYFSSSALYDTNQVFTGEMPAVSNVLCAYTSITNVYAMTNDTSRFDYRRLCGLSWLLSIADRSILTSEESYYQPQMLYANGYLNDYDCSGAISYVSTNLTYITRGPGRTFYVEFSNFRISSTESDQVEAEHDLVGGQQIRCEKSPTAINGSILGNVDMTGFVSSIELKEAIPNDGAFHLCWAEYSGVTGNTLMKIEGNEAYLIFVEPTDINAICSIGVDSSVRLRWTESPATFQPSQLDRPSWYPQYEENGIGNPPQWVYTFGMVRSLNLIDLGNVICRDDYFKSDVDSITFSDLEGEEISYYSKKFQCSPSTIPLSNIFLEMGRFHDKANEVFVAKTGCRADDIEGNLFPPEIDPVEFLAKRSYWSVGGNDGDRIYGDYKYIRLDSSGVDDNGNDSVIITGITNDGQVSKGINGVKFVVRASMSDTDVAFATNKACSVGAHYDYDLIIDWKYKNLRLNKDE